MNRRRYRTGNIIVDEKNITREILMSLGLEKSMTSDDAWNSDMCRQVVQYMPMRYLRFYLKTQDGWTSTWMEAVNNEIADRALFNTRYKKLPYK